MKPFLRLAFLQFAAAPLTLLSVAGAQATPPQPGQPPSLRSQLGLPGLPSTPKLVRPGLPSAQTPLSPVAGSWKLPDAAATLPTGALRVQSIVAVAGNQAARLGLLDLRLTGTQLSRDLRWQRVTLSLHNLSTRTLPLGGLSLRASGEGGSELAVMPGLYDQAGQLHTTLAASQTLELAAWIGLPVEGSGETGLRGGELAARLTVTDGSTRALAFALPTRR